MSLNRRGFLLGAVSTAVTVRAADATPPQKGDLPVPPPGAGTAKELMRKCTACNLCIARCPSNVLKAAGLEYGLSGLMMPRMDFTRGFCRPDCNECGKACPAGAIRPFAASEKKDMRQAVAVYAKDACLVTRERLGCGNCAEHCPYRAIKMEKDADGKAYPKVDASACAGCGACEYHCPTKAIRVVGRAGEERVR